MTVPDDPRIWHGLRAHLDELGAVATAPPIGVIRDRRPSREPLPAIAGLAGVGAIVLMMALAVPGLLDPNAPITGVTPTPSSAPTPPASSPVASPSGAPVDAAELIGYSYVATTVTERGEPFASVAEARLGLRFNGPTEFFAGAACNGMGGNYEVVGGRLVLTHTVVPLRSCGGPGIRDEGWYYTFLQSSPTIVRDATGLVLAGGDVVVTYRHEWVAASPVPTKLAVSERELLATFDVLSELPGFQVGGLTPEGDEVLVYWHGEFGPQAQAAVNDAARRGIVVNMVAVPYSSEQVRTMATTVGTALGAKGINVEGYRFDVDAVVVWGTALDASAEARGVAEDIAADILPDDLRFAIERSPEPVVPLGPLRLQPSAEPADTR